MQELQNLSMNNADGFLRMRTFFKSVPESFTPRSICVANFQYDPKVRSEEIVARLAKHYTLVFRSGSDLDAFCVFTQGADTAVTAEIQRGWLALHGYGMDESGLKLRDQLLGLFQDIKFRNEEKGGVWLDCTYLTDDGPQRTTRFIKCPLWQDIAQNYGKATQDKMNWLIGLKDMIRLGRLIIWHGPTGVGKTFALRSFLMAIRDRYKFVLVTDPERFVHEPGYYLRLGGDAASVDEYDDDGNRLDKEAIEAKKRERTLFIMEDAADLVVEESRKHNSDSIGRLLNMTDGIFGQGREDLFMVTFNEKITEIDQAFLRPGRCIMHHEFRNLEGDEATEWLRRRGIDRDLRDETSLAKLYEIDASVKGMAMAPKEEVRKVGFRK